MHADSSAVALVDHRYKFITRGAGVDFNHHADNQFYDLLADPQETNNLVKQGMSDAQSRAYADMVDAVVDYWPSAMSDPLPNMIDVPSTHMISFNRSKNVRSGGFVPIGFPAVNGKENEVCLLVRFDVESIPNLIPPGYEIQDVEHAQIILYFDRDYASMDSFDTGVLTAYPAQINWHSQPVSPERTFDGYDPVPLGSVDLAQDLFWNNAGDNLDFESGTPFSLGRNSNLIDAVENWLRTPGENYGVLCRTDFVDHQKGNQQVRLLPHATLRLTFRAVTEE
jgi:hypothetical protein